MRLNIHKKDDELVCILPSCNNIFLYDGTKAHRKYCSHKCAASAKRPKNKTKKAVSCSECSKRFRRVPSKIKEFNYCSVKCSNIGWSKRASGKGNPRWGGGTVPIHWYGQTWRRQRNKTRKRDKNTCQRCKISEEECGETLHVHHIVPFACFINIKKANYLKNLTTLCRSCHKIVEGKTKQYHRFTFLPFSF